MIYIISILLILYILYLYKNSSSLYFYNTKEKLQDNLNLVISLLKNYQFSNLDIIRITESYNYFIEYPEEFDGATIVKDITQIRDLDVPAMAHDFTYINETGIKKRLKADWQYGKDMRKFEIPWLTAYGRVFLLFIINLSGIYSLKNLIKK